jgi:hypothetical protein
MVRVNVESKGRQYNGWLACPYGIFQVFLKLVSEKTQLSVGKIQKPIV